MLQGAAFQQILPALTRERDHARANTMTGASKFSAPKLQRQAHPRLQVCAHAVAALSTQLPVISPPVYCVA